MHPHVKCYIGNGAVVSPEAMLKEIDDLKAHGMDAEDRIFVPVSVRWFSRTTSRSTTLVKTP